MEGGDEKREREELWDVPSVYHRFFRFVARVGGDPSAPFRLVRLAGPCGAFNV